MAGSGALTAMIFISLIFSSSAISYFVTEMQIGETIPLIELPMVNEGSFSQEQDFKSGNFDDVILDNRSDSYENIIGIGERLRPLKNDYLLINDLNFDDNKDISNTYYINNSVLEDYGIVIVHTNGFDGDIIKVTGDGFFITSSMNPLINYKEFINYPQANQYDNVVFKTVYNKDKHSVTFNLNGQTFYSDRLTPRTDLAESLFDRKYGGIVSNTVGFTLEKFSTLNLIQSAGDYNPITLMLTFVTTFFKVILWTLPESVFPLILNVILIKTQLTALIISVVFLGRS